MQQINPKEIEVIEGTNPRNEINNLDELKASIDKHGILEPLIINNEKQLISGERRLKSAIELNMPTVPYVIKDVNVNQAMEIRIVEP